MGRGGERRGCCFPAVWHNIFVSFLGIYAVDNTDTSAQRCSVEWAMLIAVWFAILKSLESIYTSIRRVVLMEYYATMEKIEVGLYVVTRKGDLNILF